MEGSGNKILSICISTYNRCDECVRLVKKIFTLDDNRYNVVVCDDASSDGTPWKLRKLPYKNLIVKENKKNIGPCKNWYRTIDSGNAEYMLHVLDRDTLDIPQLRRLIGLLEKYDISGGYAGISAIDVKKERQKGRNTYLYNKGGEAFLYMGGVPVHPTGFIVRKRVWEQCRLKKYFYMTDKYGIYPHSYALAHMALCGDMLYAPSKFYTFRYIGKIRKSRFYRNCKKKPDFWWKPESVLKTALKLAAYLYPYADKEYRDDFIVRRFGDGLHRATEDYRIISADMHTMSHYGVGTKDVSDMELLAAGIWYYFAFWAPLDRRYAGDKKALKRALRKRWKKVMRGIWKAKG